MAAYGALGLPLAFAALPVYVYAPKFYAGLGMTLGVAGAVLLAARVADAFVDPWLGVFADRSRNTRAFIAAALIPLALGMLAMFNPPAASAGGLALWLCLCLTLTYFGFSAASIAYQAWGARLGPAGDRTRVTAMREGFGLTGVVLASILPQLFAPTVEAGLPATSWVFVAILALCAAVCLRTAPAGTRTLRPGTRTLRAGTRTLRAGTRTLRPGTRTLRAAATTAPLAALASARFRRLLLVFAINGIASAIPATLFLFFVADVLGLAQRSGLFLALYFVAAACALPLWVRTAAHWGKKRAWLASMALAIAGFIWAYSLAAGDGAAFTAICVVSGAALGADLALPAALLADTIEADRASGAEGTYFGLWNLVTKLNLAAAAGLALPALALLGYTPGESANGGALALVYCLLPCILKAIAMFALARIELDPPAELT